MASRIGSGLSSLHSGLLTQMAGNGLSPHGPARTGSSNVPYRSPAWPALFTELATSRWCFSPLVFGGLCAVAAYDTLSPARPDPKD